MEKMYMDIINWLLNNKEWIFSGIGITIISIVFGIVGKFFFKNKKDTKSKTHIDQVNNGTGSTTQIGIQNNYYEGKERSDE